MHRIIADTDALVAYARLDCWDVIRSELPVTTTRKCYNELTGHTNLEAGEKHDPEMIATKEAAQRVLDALDDSSSFTWKYCGQSVRTGEESVADLASQYSDVVEAILMMDSGVDDRGEGGRALIKRKLDLEELGITMPALGVPIGVLAENGRLSEEEACAAINQIAEREGWKSRGALRRIWESVPLECSEEPDFFG